MSMSVNTNINSMVAQKHLSYNQAKFGETLNKLSSGLRINNAKDDAAGLAIAKTMEEFSIALKQGSRNGNDGISLIQTAEGGLNQTLNILQRMREIASQASTGTYSTSDLTNMNVEYQALLSETDRVAAVTTFNGITLLNGGTVSVQVGENNSANDRLTVTLIDTDSTALSLNGTDVTSNTNARANMTALSTAINTITAGLATLGASHSNLQEAVRNNDSRVINLDTARSRIMDADFAEQSAQLSKFSIMNQSNIAMLAQSNSAPQAILQLLRG